MSYSQLNINMMKTTKIPQDNRQNWSGSPDADNIATCSLLSQQFGMKMQPTPSGETRGRHCLLTFALVNRSILIRGQFVRTIGGQ